MLGGNSPEGARQLTTESKNAYCTLIMGYILGMALHLMNGLRTITAHNMNA